MSSRNWRSILAAGGLTALVTAGMLFATWRYASPQEPRIPHHEAAQGAEREYQPGGASCDPKQLSTLPPEQASTERDHCAQVREDYRARQAELTQATRANDLAEGNLRLAHQQARIAFAQTIATVLAFVAAVLAAVFAGLAVYHSKRSADADNEALAEARAAAADARKEAAEQARRVTEQLRLTDQTMQFTAKSAYAMADTARDTRRFAAAMQTSADAAMKAADVAQRGVEQAAAKALTELRPYLFIGANAGEGEITRDTDLLLNLENAGRTPAIDVNISTRGKVLKRPVGKAQEVSLANEYVDRLAAVGPGDNVTLYYEMAQLSVEDFASIEGDEAALVIVIRIEYQFAVGGGDAYEASFIVGRDQLKYGHAHLLGEAERSYTADQKYS